MDENNNNVDCVVESWSATSWATTGTTSRCFSFPPSLFIIVIGTAHHSHKPTKYVPLMSSEGQSKMIVQIPGRHTCDCLGQKHVLINNCLECGRIICDQASESVENNPLIIILGGGGAMSLLWQLGAHQRRRTNID